MSAVLKPQQQPAPIAATGDARGDDLLTPEALRFLSELHGRFNGRRLSLLEARSRRQAGFDAGELPDFRADTRDLRDGDWRVAPIPEALLDRRVEITGPVDPRMVINALNSGANCYMADFEDSTAPTWDNLLTGQRALREAVAGTLAFTSDSGKSYALQPSAEQAVLIVRPRGWHLDESTCRSKARGCGPACSISACSPSTTPRHWCNAIAVRTSTCPSCNRWTKPRCGRTRWPGWRASSACRRGR
jgi:malate synthase